MLHTTPRLKSENAEQTEDSPEVKELNQMNTDLTSSVEEWTSKHNELLGTIHVLPKHFYSTKLKLTSKFFTKT